MPRVLIITYYWPPSGGAGVQRWLKFAKYLPQFGWDPVIYTPSNPEAPATDASLEKDIPEGITVIKRPIFEPYSAYKRFVGMKKGESVNAGFLSEKKKPGLAEKLSVWIRGNLFIPDARKFWIRPSVRFLKKYLKENPVDTIISTGPPHSMHLIALRLKNATGIRWIADFRDPWTGIDFYHRLRLSKAADRKHHRLEKMVLTGADKVVAIGGEMCKDFMDLGAVSCVAIPNGFDPEDFNEEVQPAGGKFSILHIGAINKDRNLPAFYRAVRRFLVENKLEPSNFELRFIGKVDHSVKEEIEKNDLLSYTRYESYIPHDQVNRELASAKLLYLPVNNTPNARIIQTGKIFEYLASGRPILCIGPPEGEAAKIILECEAGDCAGFEEEDRILEILDKRYRGSGEQVHSSKQSKVIQYSRKELTIKFVEELKG